MTIRVTRVREATHTGGWLSTPIPIEELSMRRKNSKRLAAVSAALALALTLSACDVDDDDPDGTIPGDTSVTTLGPTTTLFPTTTLAP